MNLKTYYTYDDIGIIPRVRSDIKSRSVVSLDVDVKSIAKLSVPFISAPMDTVCGSSMAYVLAKNGSVGLLHRFQEINKQIMDLENTLYLLHPSNEKLEPYNIGVAVGITGDYRERLLKLIESFNNLSFKEDKLWICFDTANGFTSMMEDAINWFKNDSMFYDKDRMIIIAGNIASREGYRFLNNLGVDFCRVGIGGGSACSTSVATGISAGNLSIIDEIYQYKASNGCAALIIADGGIRHSGDVVKALAVGADLVMLGRLLAGFNQSPGDVIKMEDGSKKKFFRGLASKSATEISMSLNSKNKYKNPEGIETLIPLKGDVNEFILEFTYGIKSGLSYCNSKNISEFKQYIRNHSDAIVLHSDSSLLERLPKL